ncbi:hypothetical protein HGM15179_013613 [Zosterops borbonicus]|uniref:Integrase n=1 Tax=Zosterops borbonicus TaxID=364589 RepID=A0A8K1G8A0_9PASS|nr:hypothetical protein HGM15179_013613 [Zosterops borbonicus]
MDVTPVSQFRRLKYIHVSVDTFSGAIYASVHTGEKSGDVIKHLLQAFSFMGIPKTIKTDNGLGYASREFCSFLQQWGVEHKTGIPHPSMGQAILERTHQNIKRVLNQQTQILKLETPKIRLARALFTLNFLNCSFESMNPPIIRHFGGNKDLKEREQPPVLVKDPETMRTEGPHDLITWGRAYACVSTPEGLKWVPAKWVKPYVPKVSGGKNRQVAEVSWRRKKKVPGWIGSAVKTGLLILFLLSIIGIAFGLIKKSTNRLVANATSKLRVNHVRMTSPSPEEIKMQDLPPEEEDEELSFEDFGPEAEGQ